MVAQEAWPLIAVAGVVGLVLSGIILLIPGLPTWLALAIVIVFFPGLGLMVAYFFRDPERTVPLDSELLILSPADGKILEIVQEDESTFIEKKVWRISIFLSILDVHVNRIPVSGTVDHIIYKPGEFRVAWDPKSSELNEQSQIGIEHSSGVRILFKQIAGQLARRVVYRLTEGDQVRAGERFGLIRFGSRMDILFPADMQVTVDIGDRVQAGVSVIGELVQTIDSS